MRQLWSSSVAGALPKSGRTSHAGHEAQEPMRNTLAAAIEWRLAL